MKTLTILAAFSLLAGTAQAQGGRFKVAREAAEYLIKKGSREAASEGAERLTGRIAAAAAKYGDETVEAVRKVGPRALSLADEAGEGGAGAMRLLSRHGDQAADLVLAVPGPKALFRRYGDEAADVLIRHPGVAEGVIESAGVPGIRALATLSGAEGRHVAMMFGRGGDLAGASRGKEILEVISKFGDAGCAFVWRNKKLLLGGAVLATFLENPEPYIRGTVTLTDSAIRHVVAPTIAPVGDAAGEVIREQGQDLFPWVVGFGVAGLVISGITTALKFRRQDSERR